MPTRSTINFRDFELENNKKKSFQDQDYKFKMGAEFKMTVKLFFILKFQ
jgi:hypothetical protein